MFVNGLGEPCTSLDDHNGPFSDGSLQQDRRHVKKLRSSNWILKHDNEFTVLPWPPQSPELNPKEHL